MVHYMNAEHKTHVRVYAIRILLRTCILLSMIYFLPICFCMRLLTYCLVKIILGYAVYWTWLCCYVSGKNVAQGLYGF